MDAFRSSRLRVGDDELLVLELSAARGLPPGLTKAEQEVARLVCEGLSNIAIAERRGTSARTVANQLARVFEKLGVSSRVELQARFAT